MNIFIDSNILFQDYFFENKSNNKLLEYCEKGVLNLFMSDIVRLELRRQFQKEIESKNKEINKINKDSKRLKIETNLNEIVISDQLKKFDTFYEKLQRIDNFEILPYKNEFLPDIVDRAINRKKPFTEEKSELKDAIIWKTYSEHVESNGLSDCILMTNNTSDFCAKKDKSNIHPDLLNDSRRFSVINSSFDFIKTKASIIESPEYKFSTYINSVNINEKFVLEIITTNFLSQIEERINRKIDNIHPSEILSQDYIFEGQLISHGIEILKCEKIEHEILSETALISGIVYVNCDTEVLEYNAARDHGEDQYSFYSEQYITFKVYFNFDMKENEKYSDFEITDLNIADESTIYNRMDDIPEF